MAIICSAKFLTNKFDYNKESKTFVQEISMLSHGRVAPVFARIYDDACDEGLVLVSERTGKEIVFYVGEADCDSEGDVQGWNLHPTTESIRKHPECKDFKMLVIND